MNSLKNLLIIAVLGAVGYGVYVSLAHNNADNNQPPGVAEGWPTVPKVELPSATTTVPPGGSLAAAGNPPAPAGAGTTERNEFAAGAAVVTCGNPFGGRSGESGGNLGHTDAARGRAGGHFGRADGKPTAVQSGA